jgi:hypothetical protein
MLSHITLYPFWLTEQLDQPHGKWQMDRKVIPLLETKLISFFFVCSINA